MHIMHHSTQQHMSTSTDLRERALDAWGNVRRHAGKALEGAGKCVFMLGNRIGEGQGQSIEEHCDAAHAMGERYRMRQMTKMLALAFEAGQQAPQSPRPVGAAYELGYQHGLQESARTAV